ncbi:MAG: LuxR C-terminal-related transcriptional regulator, partial [Nakamurella sp.]
GETVRRERVQAVLTATASRWARPVQPTALDGQDAESRFRELQALHAERLGAEYVHDRLDIADRAVSLGRRTGSADYTAWGLAWRIDALAQLGDRIAVEAELAVLDQVAARLQEPAWTARLLRIRAMLTFADGRLDDCRQLSDQAVASAPGDPWTQYLSLVLTAHVAQWSGEGLAEVEPLVRAAIEDAPFFARGWLALILVGLGRTSEAAVIWRAIAPHVQELPRGALESFIAQAGHARLCAALGDREHAGAVYQELVPFADLWVCGMADGPCDGPVHLQLGRLATLMDDLDIAQEHAAAALEMAHSSHFLPSVADAHLVLAEISSVRAGLTRAGAADVITHAQLALDQARQYGFTPLAEKAQALLTAHRPRRSEVLTSREEQIVALLAAGLSNRSIAQRLQLSERTVENHVSHVLTKTGHSSRAGVAAWYAGHGQQ